MISTSNFHVGGMNDMRNDEEAPEYPSDLLIMHTCIQSDPGEPTRWKDNLFGPEWEYWIQSTCLK